MTELVRVHLPDLNAPKNVWWHTRLPKVIFEHLCDVEGVLRITTLPNGERQLVVVIDDEISRRDHATTVLRRRGVADDVLQCPVHLSDAALAHLTPQERGTLEHAHRDALWLCEVHHAREQLKEVGIILPDDGEEPTAWPAPSVLEERLELGMYKESIAMPKGKLLGYLRVHAREVQVAGTYSGEVLRDPLPQEPMWAVQDGIPKASLLKKITVGPLLRYTTIGEVQPTPIGEERLKAIGVSSPWSELVQKKSVVIRRTYEAGLSSPLPLERRKQFQSIVSAAKHCVSIAPGVYFAVPSVENHPYFVYGPAIPTDDLKLEYSAVLHKLRNEQQPLGRVAEETGGIFDQHNPRLSEKAMDPERLAEWFRERGGCATEADMTEAFKVKGATLRKQLGVVANLIDGNKHLWELKPEKRK